MKIMTISNNRTPPIYTPYIHCESFPSLDRHLTADLCHTIVIFFSMEVQKNLLLTTELFFVSVKLYQINYIMSID